MAVSIFRRLALATNAAIDAWQSAPYATAATTLADLYDFRWQCYSGELLAAARQRNPMLRDARLYANASLLWSHVEIVVEFYASVIYQGDLSTDGEPLADGTRGAIPIDAQTGRGTDNTALMTALAELWSAWNWRQQMSYRPMYGAALGDVLTELVDVPSAGMVYPRIVWPGYVTEVELDSVDNVKAVTIEHPAQAVDERGQVIETYTYRKEVDGEAFRYFKNDRPFDYGDGAVVDNPYGFVPAIWDRHRIGKPGAVRGRAATDGTIQQLMQLNSIFSHAFDYQRKAFFAPIIVRGQFGKATRGGTLDLSQPPASVEDRGAVASSFDVLESSGEIGIAQAQFDVGKTLDMLEFVKDGILAASPEASFYQRLREMSQVTAPGAHQLQGDVVQRVDRARRGYDAQTVKLFQMALSMCGMRANSGDWGALTARQKAFTPYTIDSYHAGQMDFGISTRPVVIPTESERLDRVERLERLSPWGLSQFGVADIDITAITNARRAELLELGDMASGE